VSLDDVSTENLTSSNTTVVWALRAWETVDWPAIGFVGQIEKRVFLLKTKPWLMLLVCLHKLGALVAVIVLVRRSIGIPAFAENKNVRVTA
jgi:hypothetical protein